MGFLHQLYDECGVSVGPERRPESQGGSSDGTQLLVDLSKTMQNHALAVIGQGELQKTIVDE